MSSYQADAIRKGYPACLVCGLRMPKHVAAAHRVCDFCREQGYQDDGTYPARWPSVFSGEVFVTDAQMFEHFGAYEPEPLPKDDAITLAVNAERTANARNVVGFHGKQRVAGSRLLQRIRARRGLQ
jgi:hypothetical protein